MVPAEFVPVAVTMPTDTSPQLPGFLNQFLARHPVEVFVHDPNFNAQKWKMHPAPFGFFEARQGDSPGHYLLDKEPPF
jgi:hypothetical protein